MTGASGKKNRILVKIYIKAMPSDERSGGLFMAVTLSNEEYSVVRAATSLYVCIQYTRRRSPRCFLFAGAEGREGRVARE